MDTFTKYSIKKSKNLVKYERKLEARRQEKAINTLANTKKGRMNKAAFHVISTPCPLCLLLYGCLTLYIL